MGAPAPGGHRDHVLESGELGVAAEQRRLLSGPAPAGWFGCVDRSVRLDGFLPTPEPLRTEGFVPDRRTGRRERRRADDHLARVRQLLEALGRVHDVTHDRGVATGPHRADEHLAGVDADAHLDADPEVGSQRGEGLVHPQGRPHCPLGVVLVRDGRAEQGDDLVADDLVEMSAEVDDVVHQRLEARVDQALDLLGVAAGRQCREPDEIGHQHRGDSAFVGGGDESLAALGAEAGAFGRGRAARRAGHLLTISVAQLMTAPGFGCFAFRSTAAVPTIELSFGRIELRAN